MKIALAVLAVALLAGCGNSGSGSGLTNDQIKAQVAHLVDKQSGTLLVIQGVDWCVEGVSAHEWECRVEIQNNAQGGAIVQETVFAKCETSCRLEEP